MQNHMFDKWWFSHVLTGSKSQQILIVDWLPSQRKAIYIIHIYAIFCSNSYTKQGITVKLMHLCFFHRTASWRQTGWGDMTQMMWWDSDYKMWEIGKCNVMPWRVHDAEGNDAKQNSNGRCDELKLSVESSHILKCGKPDVLAFHKNIKWFDFPIMTDNFSFEHIEAIRLCEDGVWASHKMKVTRGGSRKRKNNIICFWLIKFVNNWNKPSSLIDILNIAVIQIDPFFIQFYSELSVWLAYHQHNQHKRGSCGCGMCVYELLIHTKTWWLLIKLKLKCCPRVGRYPRIKKYNEIKINRDNIVVVIRVLCSFMSF